MLTLVFPVLPFVPFVPHRVYTSCITKSGQLKGSQPQPHAHLAEREACHPSWISRRRAANLMRAKSERLPHRRWLTPYRLS